MNRSTRSIPLTGLLSLCLIAGCDLILGPNEELVASWLRLDADVVQLPETAQVHERVLVRIETGHYGRCSRQGGTEVHREDGLLVIRPFDFLTNLRGKNACIAEASLYTHEVELTFDDPGVVIIRVVGSDGEGNERMIERELVVEES